jgi:ELWxxDGT repeat protein
MAVRPLGFSLAAALVLAMALPASLAAAPYLVKDLNNLPPFSLGLVDLRNASFGPVSYFAAGDAAHGIELWRSDGTPAGTERLTDICAGSCSATPASITVHGGQIFFTADDGFSGSELWVSDGTPGSERRVRDLCPGPCSIYLGPVAAAGDHLLFFAAFPSASADPIPLELWQTDGTREGTARVTAVCTDCSTSELTPVDGKLLFVVNSSDLWATDGTAAGTRLVRSFTFPSSLVAGDGFAWVSDTTGLWRTDGTAAGTFLLKRLEDLTTPLNIARQETLFFHFVWHGMLLANVGWGDIIRSDGTPEGTFRLASFPEETFAGDLAPLDDEILFLVSRPNDQTNNTVVWSTRGTVETTGPEVALETLDTPSNLTGLGPRAVFLAGFDRYLERNQLWVTDGGIGGAAGTRRLVLPGLHYDGDTLVATGDGRAFFQTTDGILWSTDGTESGTHPVRSAIGAPGSGPEMQAALGGKLVFSARPSYDNTFLYVSDGTAAGTGLLSAQARDAASFFPFGGRLLFSALRRGSFGFDLWATDGTPAGTVPVSRNGFAHPAQLGGQVLFNSGGLDSGLESELMRTDGRTTRLVKDIAPFIVQGSHHTCHGESSNPVLGVVVDGRMLLAANDGRYGRELWASDGTPAGTVRVRDINPGRIPGGPTPCEDLPDEPIRRDSGLSSDPQGFALLGSVALFTADDGQRGRELWVTNGTFPGTHRVADLLPGPRGSAPHDLLRFRDKVYFLAANVSNGSNPGAGESLWRTDGTAAGTARVLDLALDGLPSWGRGLTVAAGRLFFTVYNETTGAELWASTGEAAGTGLVADLSPGPVSSSPGFLTAVGGGTLLFAADDGLTGVEPWRTDGTAAGTARVGDIAPGRDASSPGPFTALPTVVMTGADDGIHGREPWAIPRAEVVRPPQ